MKLKKTRNLPLIIIATSAIILLLTAILSNFSIGDIHITSPSLTISATTDKQTYLLREKVNINGSITIDGAPAYNVVVIIQVDTPLKTTLIYRTIQIGTPTMTWPVNITNIFIMDSANNPIDTAKPKSQIKIGMTVQNPQLTSRTVFATTTVFDASMIPIGSNYWSDTIDPGKSITQSFFLEIPKWATPGMALVVGNVYSAEPKYGGVAYCLEKSVYFYISRTEQGLLGYPQPSPPPPQATPGIYSTYIRLPPDPKAGNYPIKITGQASPTTISSTSIIFSVEDSSGYPPQASFAYWPATPYINMTVNFDASSSTPEGYNDKITRFEWDFGDGTPKLVKTGNPPDPTATHVYQNNGTYIITLNVTDNEGLWCITSKPIKVLLEYGPKANFTWTPLTPYNNIDMVTFDASTSQPGWSAKSQSFVPIQNYTWSFGDGTSNVTRTNPIVEHVFANPGNFTVTLTVMDAEGRSDVLSQIIQVLNSSTSVKIYDINGDNRINLIDVFGTALAFGSSPGDPRWNPACDFNHDNKIDLKDYFPVTLHFGEDP
jgi:PKD repeat protein